MTMFTLEEDPSTRIRIVESMSAAGIPAAVLPRLESDDLDTVEKASILELDASDVRREIGPY
jgi:hypothetical protein